ncbi:hypothetical protein [Azospirillum halopraeferens]|uniref:hypothetical protein n=1 Tax=Azospirillum halopraeferens TaxID=34010 RepID=UPI00048D75B3|nr:hypothetical protein [Azospirillum halopraeferens]
MSDTQQTAVPAAPAKLSPVQMLSDLLTSAVNLRVATIIGDVTMTGRIEDMQVTVPATATTIITNTNLVAGDVTTVVSRELLNDTYKDLVERHYAAVTAANQSVRDTVGALLGLIGSLKGNELPAPSARAEKPITVTPAD